jgi:hypothetical protein
MESVALSLHRALRHTGQEPARDAVLADAAIGVHGLR